MLSKALILAWTGFIAWSFLSGMEAVHEASAPDDALVAYVLIFSLIIHGFIWGAVAMPIYVISRMFQRDKARQH